jgi:hypothetical protein
VAGGWVTVPSLVRGVQRDGALFHSDGKARAVLVDGEAKVPPPHQPSEAKYFHRF